MYIFQVHQLYVFLLQQFLLRVTEAGNESMGPLRGKQEGKECGKRHYTGIECKMLFVGSASEAVASTPQCE